MTAVVGGLLACGVAASGPAFCGAATDSCGIRMSEQAL
jgi:hypothetical protein